MNRLFGIAAFGLGLGVLAWVGLGFVGTSPLALLMTALIAAVFVLGAWEIQRLRAANQGLAAALDGLASAPADLPAWLPSVPAALRPAVRQRIEDARTPLPGPALTPYLVGLLVMLGMLGTFLGMVLTFKGAAFALEGSGDLQAMRAALAAPIQGLGLAFGTSIAGVATSALLGLMSALARRERAELVRRLDGHIAAELRPFSLSHQRQESLRAMQQQAQAWPQLADRLSGLMDGLEARSRELDERLGRQQAQFHEQVSQAYQNLATSVADSLGQSLAASARAAAEGVQPVVRAAMDTLAREAGQMHERLASSTQAQVEVLSQRFTAATAQASEGWLAAQRQQAESGQALLAGLDRSLAGFGERFEQGSAALLRAQAQAAELARAEQARLDTERLAAWGEQLEVLSKTLQGQWQVLGEQAQARQQALDESLSQSAQALTEHTATQAGEQLARVAQVLGQAEALVAARVDSEARWNEQQAQHMDALAAHWRDELARLSEQQARQGQAAAEHLARQQAALVDQAGQATQALREASEAAAQRAGAQAEQTLAGMAGVLRQAEQLVAHRVEVEAQWARQQDQRMATLQEALAGQLAGMGEALREASERVTERAGEQATRTLERMEAVLQRSEELVASRGASEARWSEDQGRRMDGLATLWRGELAALREQQAEHGQAAVERLGELQAALATQLATLGQALEGPLDRMMRTAADVPQAAAEVMLRLREETVRLDEREQRSLQERADLIGRIDHLVAGLREAAEGQRGAIEGLVASADAVLAQAGQGFAQALAGQGEQAAALSAQVRAGAVELGALGEAFQQGLSQFAAGNERLGETLARIEAAIGQSLARSDEQLAYYVAQAREVIDLSISAQQGIVEDLRRLRGQRPAAPQPLEGAQA